MSSPFDNRRESYLAEADSWAVNGRAAIHASRRTAWIVASAAVAVALCEALALVILLPLKRVEPYTLLVDRQTGYVQLLKPLDPQLIESNTALTQSFLVQYVIARESFDIDSLQSNYKKVASWSLDSARSDYLARMPASNPASPLAMYPRSTIIDVSVKSISPLAKHVAMVRFDTIRRDAGQQQGSARPWIAVIRYDYLNKPMSMSDRLVNPLGFQVLRYQRNAEALAPAASLPEGPSSADATAPAAASAVKSPLSSSSERRRTPYGYQP